MPATTIFCLLRVWCREVPPALSQGPQIQDTLGKLGRTVRAGFTPYFSVPIHKGIDFLMTHSLLGTADLQFGLDGPPQELREWQMFTGTRATCTLASPLTPVCFGFEMRYLSVLVSPHRSGRVRLIAESTAEVFIGEHTPNSTAGSQNPVDITVGAQISIAESVVIGGGYRRLVNQAAGNRDGFVLSFSREFSN